MNKIRILFLAANPLGTSRLQLDEEIRAISEKIRGAEYRDMIELVSAWATRPDDLLQLLNQYKPQVVHFSSHGNPTGEIILVDEQGKPKPVSTQAIRSLFKALKDNIRLVVLNACYSRLQAKSIVETIDCAIGMNTTISDQAAIIFAASLYRALAFGRSIYDAFEQGKTALLLENIDENDIPDLLVRERVNASQVFLVEQKNDNNIQVVPKVIGNIPRARVNVKESNGNYPKHIYIAHTEEDNEFANKLRWDFYEQGFEIWHPFRLVTGSPEWESVIRDVIEESFAVFLIVSPNSQTSTHIRHLLSLARVVNCPVYPLWASGDRWIDCAPIDVVGTQYFDCRSDEKYTKSSLDVITAIKNRVALEIPKHIYLNPIRTTQQTENSIGVPLVPIPFGCLSIELVELEDLSQYLGKKKIQRKNKDDSGVVINPFTYSSIYELLNDLYTNYLHERFEPFTYGKHWLLAENSGPIGTRRLLAPWSWFACEDKETYRLDIDWASKSSPDMCGLRPSSRWTISTNLQKDIFCVAANDKKIISTLTGFHPKQVSFLLSSEYVKKASIKSIKPDEFEFIVVLQGKLQSFRKAEVLPHGYVLKQVKTLDDDIRIFLH